VTMAAGRRKEVDLLEEYKADDQIVFSPLASLGDSRRFASRPFVFEQGLNPDFGRKRP
jgi:hypothetical protein